MEIDFLKSKSSGDCFEYDAEALKQSVFDSREPAPPKLTAAALQRSYLPGTKVKRIEVGVAVQSERFIQSWSELFGWKGKELVAGDLDYDELNGAGLWLALP